MQISRNELVKALEAVKPGLADRELIEQTTSFAFIGDKVVTYNNEISLSYPIEGLDITGAIKADELYKLLTRLRKDEIELELEGKQILLKCGRIKAGLAIQDEIKLPLEEIKDIGRWRTLPENFIKALTFSSHAASNDYSRPLLTCIHINKDGYVEATDNFRICKYELKGNWVLDNTLIPVNNVKEVIKMNPSNVAKGKGWIHFMNEEGCNLSCRIFQDDTYVNFDDLLKVQGEEIVFPNLILDTLERATIFTNTCVDIHIKENKIRIKSSNETSWFEETLNIRYENEIDISITPELFKDILSVTKKGIIGERVIKFEMPGEFQYNVALAKKF
jgi:DNA polymerase III sliding clamp (beta) subunit (PCNA family)